MESVLTKTEIRRRMKELRRTMAPADKAAKEDLIFRAVAGASFFHSAGTIYTYVSTPEEVDTIRLIRAGWEAGKKIAVPRVEGRAMNFYYIGCMADLEAGCMGILEPKAGLRPAEKPGLVIVPGLAFDRRGYRVGYGGGYYDRYFAGRTGDVMAGLCFDFQIVDRVPSEPFDKPVGCVITECYRWGGSFIESEGKSQK